MDAMGVVFFVLVFGGMAYWMLKPKKAPVRVCATCGHHGQAGDGADGVEDAEHRRGGVADLEHGGLLVLGEPVQVGRGGERGAGAGQPVVQIRCRFDVGDPVVQHQKMVPSPSASPAIDATACNARTPCVSASSSRLSSPIDSE